MMILDKIIDIHKQVLEKISCVQPECARQKFNLVNFVCIQLLNANKLKVHFYKEQNGSFEDSIKFLKDIEQIDDVENKLIQDFYNEYKEVVDFSDILKCHPNNVDLIELYERILALDIQVQGGYFTLINDNKARDRAGAYYTSHEFAKVVVKKAIDKYIKKKIGCNENIEKIVSLYSKEITQILHCTTIVDLSCGTANFLTAVIEYLQELEIDGLEINRVIENLYGFDIDLTALKIAITELACKNAHIESVSRIQSNFIFGNTLISCKGEGKAKKVQEYLSGYIYSPHLGINQDTFKEKFDLVVGNPPWEKVRSEDKNFFVSYAPEITLISKKNERSKAIQALESTNISLYKYYNKYIQYFEQVKKELKSSKLFSYSSNGELNTYALFTELGIRLLKKQGEVCLIVKSSMITSTSNKELFTYLLVNNYIDGIYDFINTNKIFPIDARERFAVIFCNKSQVKEFELAMNLKDYNDILKDGTSILVNQEVLNKINPETNLIPNIQNKKELKFLVDYANRFNTFIEEYPHVKFGRLVHLTTHADFIIKSNKEGYVPIYEGKFIEIYDAKFSTFEGIEENERYKSKAQARLLKKQEKEIIDLYPKSRYFLEEEKWNQLTKNYPGEYSLCWRSLTSTSNRRIMLATILPHVPTIQSIQFLQKGADIQTLILLLAVFNSVIFDYLVSLKLSNIDLTQAIIKQIPVPSREKFDQRVEFMGQLDTIKEHINKRVLGLYKNDERFFDLRNKLGVQSQEIVNREREKIIVELDYLVASLYGTDKCDLIQMMGKFSKFYNDGDINYLIQLK